MTEPYINAVLAADLRRHEAQYEAAEIEFETWWNNLVQDTREVLEALFSEDEINTAFWEARRMGRLL